MHREGDKPAVIYSNDKYNRRRSGTRQWYQNGVLHRDTLDDSGHVNPAVITGNDEKEWWIHGKRVSRLMATAMTTSNHESIAHRVKKQKRCST